VNRAGLALLGAVALAGPAGAQEPPGAREQVLALVDSALAAVNRNDPVAFTDLMLEEAVLFRAFIVEGSPGYRARTRAEERVMQYESRVVERGFRPEVRIAGGLATVWLPYDFYLDGKWSHCGVDQFTFVRTAAGWRIAAMAWTIEQPPACQPHPDGPPEAR
jgi:hypothetical protein